MSKKPPLRLRDHQGNGVNVPLIGQMPEVPPLCVRAAGDLWSQLLPAIDGAIAEVDAALSLPDLPATATEWLRAHQARLHVVAGAARSTHARALTEACAPNGPMERTAKGLAEHVLKISEALEKEYGKHAGSSKHTAAGTA